MNKEIKKNIHKMVKENFTQFFQLTFLEDGDSVSSKCQKILGCDVAVLFLPF